MICLTDLYLVIPIGLYINERIVAYLCLTTKKIYITLYRLSN